MLGEFKAFIQRGKVLDLAVAVIIGAAFGAVVTSLTDDLIMPLIGAATGGIDFNSDFVQLGATPAGYTGAPTDYAALNKAGVPLLGFGAFVTAVVNFTIARGARIGCSCRAARPACSATVCRLGSAISASRERQDQRRARVQARSRPNPEAARAPPSSPQDQVSGA